MGSRQKNEEALLQAATTLISERGIQGVTVRDIADKAGLQHSLIFRYFGSYDNLVNVVFERLSEKIRDTLGTDNMAHAQDGRVSIPTFNALLEQPGVLRLLIHALLEDDDRFMDPDRARFDATVSLFKSSQKPGYLDGDNDAELAALSTYAMLLGWALIEPKIPKLISDKRRTPRSVRKDAVALWMRLLKRK